VSDFVSTLRKKVGDQIQDIIQENDEVTLEIKPSDVLAVCQTLRDDADLKFQLLIDICGVDYLEYGLTEWQTTTSTATGFSRGTDRDVPREERKTVTPWDKPRFAAVYHLLSITHNRRVRLRVFLDPNSLIVPSVVSIWHAADWFEREAFDLFGILFDGHPDLRRLLTDYGFVGHPFRKDFPLIGNVEMRYDAAKRRCVYEPVSIQPRTLVPKVIREHTHIDVKDQDNG